MIEKFFYEKLSLIIFKKIAELVGSLHKIGLIHTNLELDNFLLDADKNLLIIIMKNDLKHLIKKYIVLKYITI